MVAIVSFKTVTNGQGLWQGGKELLQGADVLLKVSHQEIAVTAPAHYDQPLWLAGLGKKRSCVLWRDDRIQLAVQDE